MAEEDPELQRRLDVMFGSARPRQGFEEELWRRLEARRPWRQRLANLLRPAPRFAPAIAALVVVAVGAGLLLNAGRLGQNAGRETSSSYSGAAPPAGAAAFGRLPNPLLSPSAAGAQAGSATGAPKSADRSGGGYLFTGRLPILAPSLTVYRYREPSTATRAALTKSLRDRTGLAVKIGEVRRGSAEVPGFSARSSAGASPLPTVEATVAAFVQAHRLTPSFPFQVITSLDGRGVIYVRQFPGPSGQAPEVGHDGALTGLRVSVESGAITVEGPLDLPLDAAEYPARAAADALSGLGLANPGAATGGEIVLDTARLVYLAIPAAGEGFYEPMLLLSGSGTGVLAPLIAPDQLRS